MGLRTGEAEGDLRHIPCTVAELDDWVLCDGVGHVEIRFQRLTIASITHHEITVLTIGRIVFHTHAREVGELEHGRRAVFEGCEERRESVKLHERGGTIHTILRGSFKSDGLSRLAADGDLESELAGLGGGDQLVVARNAEDA